MDFLRGEREVKDVGADGEVRGYLLDYLFFGDCEQVALTE